MTDLPDEFTILNDGTWEHQAAHTTYPDKWFPWGSNLRFRRRRAPVEPGQWRKGGPHGGPSLVIGHSISRQGGWVVQEWPSLSCDAYDGDYVESWPLCDPPEEWPW